MPTFEEYAAQWGGDPVYDKAPRLRGDGYLFYNFSVEGNDPEFLKKFLPAIERTIEGEEAGWPNDPHPGKPRKADVKALKRLKAEVQRRIDAPPVPPEKKYYIGDVVIHLGEPDNSNPYRGCGSGTYPETHVCGDDRVAAFHEYKETGKRGKYTFWYAPASGGAKRINNRDEIDWTHLRTKER